METCPSQAERPSSVDLADCCFTARSGLETTNGRACPLIIWLRAILEPSNRGAAAIKQENPIRFGRREVADVRTLVMPIDRRLIAKLKLFACSANAGPYRSSS